MIYRSKTSNSDNPRQKILIIFLILVIVVGGLRFFFPNQWSSVVVNSSRPFLAVGRGLSSLSSRMFGSISFGGKSTTENQQLKKEIENLSLQLNDRELLVKENISLKDMLARTDRRDSILAVVISKPTITPYDTFLIDAGRDQGIKQNALVLAGNNTSIGIVTEVYSNLSKVTAYSSPSARHLVFIGEKNLQAEAVGQGNGNFKVVLPEGSEVKVGDPVILPNITPTMFGVVEKIVPGSQPSFVDVLFKMQVNLSELYYVQVVK